MSALVEFLTLLWSLLSLFSDLFAGLGVAL